MKVRMYMSVVILLVLTILCGGISTIFANGVAYSLAITFVAACIDMVFVLLQRFNRPR